MRLGVIGAGPTQREPLSRNYSISAVPPEHLDEVWAELEPFIERGLRHSDDTTPEILKASIRSEGYQLWVAVRDSEVVAGLVLEIQQRPIRRVVFIHMLAGRERHGWFDEGFELIKAYRDLNDAETIEAECRPGMVKFLEDQGWARKAVIMKAPE